MIELNILAMPPSELESEYLGLNSSIQDSPRRPEFLVVRRGPLFLRPRKESPAGAGLSLSVLF